MPKIVTREEYEKRLKDLGTGVILINCNNPVGTFKCVEGHIWESDICKVSKGKSGCPVCAKKYKAHTKESAKDLIQSLGFTLESEYRGVANKYKFSCQNSHEWEAVFYSVARGDTGCPHCSKKAKKTLDEVIEKLAENNIRLLSELKTVKDLHDFKCRTCSYEWTSILEPKLHETKATGCPKCSNRLKIPISEVVDYCKNVGYKVLSKDYFGPDKDRVKLECSEGHQWEVSRGNLMHKGRGCPSCASYGFNPNKPAIMYYLRVDAGDKTIYKIGITNRSVQERFCNEDLEKITVLRELHFDVGSKAYELEQYYLNIFKDYQHHGAPILKSGNTELFTYDILGVDK